MNGPRLFCAALGALMALAAPALAQDDDELDPGIYLKIETSMGTMTAKLHHEKVPMTVMNIVGLVEGSIEGRGKDKKPVKGSFYDGLTFHRVMSDFMIQGGCPLGTGMGNPGYKFQDETVRGLTHDAAGVLSMANSDRRKAPWSNSGKTNGSQFFITVKKTAHLDGLHTVFGRLVSGHDVLKTIAKVKTSRTNNRPVKPVVMNKVTVLRIGDAAKAWEPRTKSIDEPKGEPDPKKVPKKDQKAKSLAQVNIICIRYKGCWGEGIPALYDEDEAKKIAERVAAHARLPGVKFSDLAKRYSDLRLVRYHLVAKHNDSTLKPCYSLLPGQVSDAVMTPYGFMVFEGL